MRQIALNKIAEAQAWRHEHVLWKFAFAALFLALGQSEFEFLGMLPWMSLALIVAAPFVAMAFDIYIFAEDYRIRRARSQSRPEKRENPETEKHPVWHFFHDLGPEHFKASYPGPMNEVVCLAVTGAILAASCIVLRINGIPWQSVLWFGLGVAMLDLLVLGAFWIARSRLPGCPQET
jgi:hypothetical protein